MNNFRTEENTYVVFKGVDHSRILPKGLIGLFEEFDPKTGSGYNGKKSYTGMVITKRHTFEMGMKIPGARIVREFSTQPFYEGQKPAEKIDDVNWFLQKSWANFNDNKENTPVPVFAKIDNKNRKISKVFVRIIGGEQVVGLKAEGLENDVYLSQQKLKSRTGVNIAEVEILTNSLVSVEFYQINEIMKNGTVCDIANMIVKEFSIKISGTIEQMRENYRHLIPELKQIVEVFRFIRNGKKYIGLRINETNKVYINSNRLTRLTLLKPEAFHVLVSSYINPIYYEEGELLVNKKICRKNNRILKELNLRYNDKKMNLSNDLSQTINEEHVKGQWEEDGWHDEDELRENEMWDDAIREVDSWGEEGADWDFNY